MSNWWDSTQRHHLYGHHHGQVELLHHFLLALTTLLRMRLLVLWLWPSLTMDIWRIIAFAGFDMELSILRLRYSGACRLTLYWLMLLCWLWPLERIQRLLNDKMPCSAAYGQHHHESSLQLILTLPPRTITNFRASLIWDVKFGSTMYNLKNSRQNLSLTIYVESVWIYLTHGSHLSTLFFHVHIQAHPTKYCARSFKLHTSRTLCALAPDIVNWLEVI